MFNFLNFLINDAGAVTIDWVGISAIILVAGIMTTYAIYNDGVSSLVVGIGENSDRIFADVDVGAAVQQNR